MLTLNGCFHSHTTTICDISGNTTYLVNDKYGEFTIVPATMANMQDVILKRVAFGSVRDL